MARVWILRSLRFAGYEQLAFSDELIAIGWGVVGNLASFALESQIRDAVRATYPFVGQESVKSRASQLFQFRTVMTRGDIVILLRHSSPGVAVGWVAGEYLWRGDAEREVQHIRPVIWKRHDLSRASIEWLLLSMPTLTMIYSVEERKSFEKLIDLIESDAPFKDTDSAPLIGSIQELATPFANLKRNLNYARNLATAGHHLTQLQVSAFEVPDVFRAAWVQGVAALDYWVRQEVRARMIWLAQRPGELKPKKFASFEIPLGEIENILQSRSSLADVLDQQLSRTRGHLAYQHPNKIREALQLVSDVPDLWNRVASVLNEQAGDGPSVTSSDVRKQLADIVERRNKIAHEYDEDPENPPAKRLIDAAMVTQTIEWIEQLAAAILVVLGPNAASRG